MSEETGIKRYLAGALLANGIRIILAFLFYALLPSLPYVYEVLGVWIIIIFSTALSGFLLTRKKKKRHILSGGVVGFYSYILYVLLSFFGFAIQVEDLWIFLGCLIGGLLGGRLGESGGMKIDLKRLFTT